MDGVGEEWMDDDQGLIFDVVIVFKCLPPSEDPAPLFFSPFFFCDMRSGLYCTSSTMCSIKHFPFKNDSNEREGVKVTNIIIIRKK